MIPMIKTISVMVFILFIAFLLNRLCVIRSCVTYKNHAKIIDAISIYRHNCYKEKVEPIVNYLDMEQYSDTYSRLWDWGCSRILPKEKYEIIKEYIEEV